MSTTIGEVSINLRLSMAKFQTDVAQGSNAVRKSADDLGESVTRGSTKARESLALISEMFGVSLPRGVRSFIAELPGVGTALNSAFGGAAVLLLVEAFSKLVEKARDYYATVGTLSDEQKKKLEEEAAAASKALAVRLQSIKAEFDLQIARASGLDKLKLEQQEAIALGAFAKSGLDTARADLDLAKQKRDALEQQLKTMQAQKDAGTAQSSFGGAPNPQVVLGMWNEHAAANALKETLTNLKAANQDIAAKQAALDEAQKHTIESTQNLTKADRDAANTLIARREQLQDFIKLVEAMPGATRPLFQLGDVQAQASALQEITDKLKALQTQAREPLYGGTSEAMQLTTLQTDQNAAIQAGQQAYTDTRTAAEQYSDAVQQLVVLLDRGTISEDTFGRAVTQAAAKLNNTTKIWSSFGKEAGRDLSDLVSGTESLGQAFEKLAIDIAVAVAKMELLKFGGGGTGFFGSLVDGLLSGLGGHASGGYVDAGVPGWVGERGPEIFIPKTAGYIVPANRTSDFGGGFSQNTTVVQNISTPNADSFRRSSSQLMTEGYRTARVAAAQNRGR